MQPAARPSFQPAAAGGVLLGTLLGSIAIGALVGWALGSVGYGVLVGALVGIPLAVFSVYRRYRRSF
jgi:F0F1-type ATP synthase assembly protein I